MPFHCNAFVLFNKFQFMEQNRTTPTEFQKTVGVNLCLLRCIYTFADSRGRLSLQGEIKLPYEKAPFGCPFVYMNARGVRRGAFHMRPQVLRRQNGRIWNSPLRYCGNIFVSSAGASPRPTKALYISKILCYTNLRKAVVI